ncbi:alpha-mannosidase [Candidatus Poribacteria bacterium]|nr:alpha-mannosidase [Candidatus Poribacteria bacterium]
MPHFDAERQVEGRQINDRLKEIQSTIYSSRVPINNWEAVVTGKKQGPSAPPETGWKPFEIGSSWGGKDVTMWFKSEVVIPEDMARKKVALVVRPGGESLIYVNGKPCQGLDRNREEVVLLEKAEGSEKFEILVESYSSARFDEKHNFRHADIVTINPNIWEFYWNAKVVFDVIQVLENGSGPQLRMLDLLNNCIKHVDIDHKDRESYMETMAETNRMLEEGIKEFQHSFGFGSLLLCGHSHIDTAWLWPLRETHRKCGRTFSTVLNYMKEYPYYHFSQSQPQLYEFTKKYYPDVYEEIRKRVNEGLWEPVGATWVEQDSNVSSGESLVRQVLYGNRFFRKEFGIHSRTCWLPDAFGFCWSLPQILKKAGVDFFATTKIDWSQYSKFPYSLFNWQGIDGTEILSIMPPLNYNGSLSVKDCIAQWDQFRQKDQCDEVLYSFGYGDGGGGPTKEMLETGIRLENMVGVPKCTFGKIQDYFDRIEKAVDDDKLPVWNGELYLEYHRACQTTQARTKRNNRKSELLYRNAEFLSAMAMLTGGDYPQEKLYEGWKVILCNQFHDILPGSSINEVYKDADEDYSQVLKSGEEVVTQAVGFMSPKINTTGEGKAIIVVNTLSWDRDDIATAKVQLESDKFRILDKDGQEVPSQIVGKDGDETEIIFEANNIPSMGYSVYHLVEGESTIEDDPDLAVLSQSMENSLYRIELNKDGELCRIYDKMADREVLPEGSCGNVLQFFVDRPHAHDAWDIDFNFEEKPLPPANLESAKVIETGPVRATVRIIKKTEKSTITQNISIYNKIPRVDFATDVDWWEKHVLMKVAFPVDVLSPRATYEIQFGTIERPTHFNTSWDRAKFEVPAQKWTDLSEGDYGLSILNDCKYGHDIHNNIMRISLLRSPTSPDPKADEGKHQFVYSLHPHKGDWRKAETVQRAYEINSPLLTLISEPRYGELPKSASFVCVDKKHVVIDTIKKAEDNDDIILRLYEAYGQRGEINMEFIAPPKEVAECNLMEEGDEKMKISGSNVSFYIKPYEIRTFKVKFGS